ncbi:FAD/NAD(P)-binding protein [Streptomyces zagrosensis]|uniref:Putative NAD(P)/FAD-binding protein YdhS n=1 Tax=Streptomyces zagrosensis TaxID=1042984 RepID=A0A7W9QBX9_9ACTN|nr:FAD/NAD(P)-binding protein [Streptomyces zagrosensis]MBB5937433.1 putative NAD(P)/FAD-binding protein YdhS [Streptomyces zagrosensis]
MSVSPNSSPLPRRPRPPAIAIVGAGPRAVGLIARIAARATELPPVGGLIPPHVGASPHGGAVAAAAPDGAPPAPSTQGSRFAPRRDSRLLVHLIDPHPPGGGRVWRPEQSSLLWMNSMAADVSVFDDGSRGWDAARDGPPYAGPSLAEWAQEIRAGRLNVPLARELADEVAALTGRTFATRRLQSAYLGWVYERAVAALPPGVELRVHRRRAVRVAGPREASQRVWLEGRELPLVADAVVLALGHLDAETDPAQTELAHFAAHHGLTYLPPEYTADSDLQALHPGEPVLVRGFGLAFIDLMVLLTEGRGGTYADAAGAAGAAGASGDGPGGGPGGGPELVYRPSGREPVLYVGSRRGVPYHSKIGYDWHGELPPLPRFFGPPQVAELLRRPGPVDFAREVWPLCQKELGYAHYHRLFTAHPGRTRASWQDFEEKYAACEPGSEELAALVAATVPDPADRIDLVALDRPLTELTFPSTEALQDELRRYITADLARHHDPEHSPDLAVFLGLLSLYGQVARLGDIGPWWHGFFSYVASGPPGPRLRQLLALSRAGVVRFIGAEMTVTADPARGVFTAASDSVPGHTVQATALVEARLPNPSVARSRDRLLRALYEDDPDGVRATAGGLLAVHPDDARVLDRTGRPHPRRFAIGAHTDTRVATAFARPGTGAPAVRQNDAVARALLELLTQGACPARLSA